LNKNVRLKKHGASEVDACRDEMLSSASKDRDMQLLADSPRLLGLVEDLRIGLDLTGNIFIVAATIGLMAAFWNLVREA
jgi:hypothetical protein